jgi:phytoene dehydrogenase-like protein
MIAHLEHNTGAFFPINGMYGIVDALIKLAVELGVEFHYNEAVKTITTFGNKVTAVYTEKQSYPCNLVVNDTDVTYFYRHLLPNKNDVR